MRWVEKFKEVSCSVYDCYLEGIERQGEIKPNKKPFRPFLARKVLFFNRIFKKWKSKPKEIRMDLKMRIERVARNFYFH